MKRGFTLVEVLISLAIFALGSIVLAVAYLNVLGGYQSVAKRQQSEEEWKLVRAIVLSEADREKVEAGGQLQLPDNSNVHWKATIEDTTVADLFAVTVRSEPEITSGNEARAREQRIFLLRPRWSDPVERNRLRAESQERLAKQRQQ
jgi:prepilin-type N-terminal cleavage/methylation domain-containing protein